VIILDTDVLTLVQRGKGEAYDTLVRRLGEAKDDVYVTVVSLEEQTRGWLAYMGKRRDPDELVGAYAKLHALVLDFAGRPLLAFDDGAATELNRLRRSRTRVGDMDLRIAAIALSKRATLITRNIDHFRRIPDVDAQDWTREDAAGA